jgi:hypothetical protein
MRVSYLIAAATAAAITTPAAAQGLGGILRGKLESSARDLVNKPIPTPNRKKKEQAPKSEAPAEEAQSAPETPVEGTIVVAEDMPVISSDGARVAVVKHTTTGGTNYAPDKTFFTADPYYRLRRIYGREATVRGGAVHLEMTAAQYRARGQNPED